VKTIKVAMIQAGNHYADNERGYREAANLIEQAANEGARIAILPELSGCGYIPNQSVWDCAEPTDGKTAQWAAGLSRKLGIFIGAGFVETDGTDYCNSYLISDPQGEIAGIIRKEDAESYCFKRAPGDLYVDTELGRIGIGICADNHYIDRLNRMCGANVDLMLMPHANPAPAEVTKQISEKDFTLFEEQPTIIAKAYSDYLRVPTVYVNAVGSFPEFTGGMGVKNFNEKFKLRGGSRIVDADGNLLAKMNNQVGYEVVEVLLCESAKPAVEPKVYHHKWLHPGQPLFRYLVLPFLTKRGERNYKAKIKGREFSGAVIFFA